MLSPTVANYCQIKQVALLCKTWLLPRVRLIKENHLLTSSKTINLFSLTLKGILTGKQHYQEQYVYSVCVCVHSNGHISPPFISTTCPLTWTLSSWLTPGLSHWLVSHASHSPNQRHLCQGDPYFTRLNQGPSSQQTLLLICNLLRNACFLHIWNIYIYIHHTQYIVCTWCNNRETMTSQPWNAPPFPPSPSVLTDRGPHLLCYDDSIISKQNSFE